MSEAIWNEPCLAECEEKGNDASPLAKYSASKTLAEKGVFGLSLLLAAVLIVVIPP